MIRKDGTEETVLRKASNDFVFNASFRQLLSENCSARKRIANVGWFSCLSIKKPCRSFARRAILVC